MAPEPIAVTLRVIEVLDALDAPYVIGGSLASSVHGVARTTMDADLVADLKSEQVERLVQELRNEFYVDADAIREAIRFKRSFSLIHLESAFKVDVFIPQQRRFDRTQLDRKVKHVVATDPERTAYIASAEDTILAKLEWYHVGHEVSERQWRDISGILQVQGKRLDLAYLRQIAASLDLSELLQKALREAQL